MAGQLHRENSMTAIDQGIRPRQAANDEALLPGPAFSFATVSVTAASIGYAANQ